MCMHYIMLFCSATGKLCEYKTCCDWSINIDQQYNSLTLLLWYFTNSHLKISRHFVCRNSPDSTVQYNDEVTYQMS